MKNQQLETQLSDFLGQFPKEKVLEYYPRQIITPSGYLDPLYFSVINFRFINSWGQYAHNPALIQMKNRCRVFSKVLTEKNVPTYFVAEAFLDVVDQTDLLESFTFSQLHFPMPGFLLVLPAGFIKQRAGVDAPFVMISTYQGYLYLTPIVLTDDGSSIHLDSSIRYEGVDDGISATINSRENFTDDMENKHPLDVRNPELHEAAGYVFELMMKFLIILSTKPTVLIEPEASQPLRKPRIKKGRVRKPALWNPIFIGKGFAARGSGVGGVGASKRTHWRKGHCRSQRYGANRSLVRVIWIEPMLIQGEFETVNSISTDVPLTEHRLESEQKQAA